MSGFDNYPVEIEQSTVNEWLASGVIKIDTTGNENTYYVDQFGNEFYCKNYPSDYNRHCYPIKF